MANLMCRKSLRTLFESVNHSSLIHCCKLIKPICITRFYSGEKSAVSRYFTRKHEWVVVNDNEGTVGISQYAQNSLGDIVFVQLPEVGSDVNPQDECGALESVKAASELYSPVSGTVVQVNTALEEKPELVNKSCYEEGWLFKLKLKDLTEVEALMNEDQYSTFLKSDQ